MNPYQQGPTPDEINRKFKCVYKLENYEGLPNDEAEAICQSSVFKHKNFTYITLQGETKARRFRIFRDRRRPYIILPNIAPYWGRRHYLP